MSLFLMQPSFLPWIGFFDMALSADKLVFLDDVKFSKGSWVNRNRIKTKKGLEWITVPLKKNRSENIADIEIFVKSNLLSKIQNSIEQSYNKSEYFNKYQKDFFNILSSSFNQGKLSDMNQELIIWILKKMKVEKKIYRSSDLKVEGKKVERIVNICKKLKENNYITTPGSTEYLRKEIDLFKNNNINIQIHNYLHPTYKQLYGKFLSHASIIDLLFNEGQHSLDIIYSGRLKSLNLK